MRQETDTICRAFLARLPKRAARTHTDGLSLYLHGNRIAYWGHDGHIYITLAGYGTSTTRDRLNGLLKMLEIEGGFYQHKSEQFFGKRRINTSEVICIRMHNGKRAFNCADAIMIDNDFLPALDINKIIGDPEVIRAD